MVEGQTSHPSISYPVTAPLNATTRSRSRSRTGTTYKRGSAFFKLITDLYVGFVTPDDHPCHHIYQIRTKQDTWQARACVCLYVGSECLVGVNINTDIQDYITSYDVQPIRTSRESSFGREKGTGWVSAARSLRSEAVWSAIVPLHM